MSGPCYGRVQEPESPSALLSLHLHDGVTPLKEVDHETPLGVLDQSDLIAQGIHTSRFIAGCKQDAEALGSCVFNTAMEWAAWALPLAAFVEFCRALIADQNAETPKAYDQTAAAERSAIALYHLTSDQTGNPATEWPPTDCGSSGAALGAQLMRLGIVSGQQITHAGSGLVSLLQTELVLMGSPWFYAWEEPDSNGFIDGDGTAADLEAAIRSGVAAGHETSLTQIEKLTFYATGQIDPFNTILVGRNHWRKSWGDAGRYRVHLSTIEGIGPASDFRSFTPVGA